MTVSVAEWVPADGAADQNPNVPVAVRLQNAASTPLTDTETAAEMATGTLADTVGTTAGLKLAVTDTLYSLQAPAASPYLGRTGTCPAMPSGTTAWTACLAVKGGGTAYRSLLAWGVNDSNRYVQIVCNNTVLQVRNSSNSKNFAATLLNGSWHRVAVRYSGGYVRAWVDGVEVGSAQAFSEDLLVASASAEIALLHGVDGGYAAPLGTYLDEVQVWPFSVPDADIQYWDGCPTPATLALGSASGWWRFTEGAGTLYQDSGPNGYHLGVQPGGSAPSWETGSGWGENVPVYTTPGTRVSPAISVAAAVEFGDAEVTWDEVVPAGTTVTVEAASDPGGPWQAVTNGGRVTGVWAHGDALAGENLYLRYTLATTDTAVSPRVRTLTTRLIPISRQAVTVEVNGYVFGYAAGTLLAYGWRDITGGVCVDDFTDVRFTTAGRWHYTADEVTETVTVKYGGSTVDTATFACRGATDFPGGRAGGPLAAGVGAAQFLLLPETAPMAEAGATYVVVIWELGAQADAYFVVRELSYGEADCYFYVARVTINDYSGSLCVAAQWIDDAAGSLAVRGYRLDDAAGSLAIRGPKVDDACGSLCTSVLVIDDVTGGSATVSVKQLHDAVGSAAIRGVIKGPVLEAHVVDPGVKAKLIEAGARFR